MMRRDNKSYDGPSAQHKTSARELVERGEEELKAFFGIYDDMNFALDERQRKDV